MSLALALMRAFLFSAAAMQWTSAPNIGLAALPQRARGFWKGWPAQASQWLEIRLEAERRQLPLWIVVGVGAGITAWFALPGSTHWIAFQFICSGIALTGFVVARNRTGRGLGWLALAALVGSALIWLRSADVAAPRLERPEVVGFDATVERVEVLTARETVRLTLANDESALPPRVRVSIPIEERPDGLAPGARLSLRARLAPPPQMAIPGTYDFARDAWFRGIGAVGKALGPIEVTEPASAQGFEWARSGLRDHIERKLPEKTEGIAVALVTGDQNAVGAEDAEAMRRSGLTHLLSVSGLHIAAVVGAAMLLTLKLLALSKMLALRTNLLLVAAAVAASAGIGYTLLTGAQVPTVRSCVAALLVLAGIALGRDALSMRLIAIGALLVLVFRPEALAGPSFQMSFGAVTAIVALHSTAWARRWFSRREEGMAMRLARAIAALIATGLAVEVALIPIALFHFHRSGLYGVAANIIAIPLTTFVIMPLEALALLLDVIGAGAPFWWLCSAAISLLIDLARLVSTSEGAVTALPSMPHWAFAAMIVGGLWLCLWETRWRRLGLVPIAIGVLAAASAPRPDILVTGDGRHLAIVGEGGEPRMLRDRSGEYIRMVLAEASGFDGETALLSASREGRCSADSCIVALRRGDRDWRLLATRSAHFLEWRAMIAACDSSDIVVSDRRLPQGCAPRWLKLDRATLATTGGVAIYLGQKPRIVTVAEGSRGHPWAVRDRGLPNPRETRKAVAKAEPFASDQ